MPFSLKAKTYTRILTVVLLTVMHIAYKADKNSIVIEALCKYDDSR